MAKSASKKKSTAKKKSSPAKKSPAKTKRTAKPKKATQATPSPAKQAKADDAEAAADSKKKKAAEGNILLRSFDPWAPAAPYRVEETKSSDVSSPPFFGDLEASEAEKLRPLLFKEFRLDAAASGSGGKEEEGKGKKAPAPEKPADPREVLFRTYGGWRPESPHRPPEAGAASGSAPPYFGEAEGEELHRLRSLLFKTFDLSRMASPAETPEAPPAAPAEVEAPPEAQTEEPAPEPEPEREPPPIRTLLARSFDTWTPATPYRPEPSGTDSRKITAPPFVTGENEAETERQRKLLFLDFDLSRVTPAEPSGPTAEAPEPAPRPEAASAEEEPPVDQPAAHFQKTAGKVIRPTHEPPSEAGRRPQAPDTEAPKAPEPETPVPPTPRKGYDPMETTLKFFAACLILVFVFIIGASFSNASKYYLRPTENGAEIWKGSFAPMGKERVVRLPGVGVPENIRSVYGKEELFPIAFDYYLNRANEILEAPGVPDYQRVKANLNKAIDYGTKGNVQQAFSRMKDVEILILMNKADIAAAKRTDEGLKEAISYLEKARKMDSNNLLDLDREGYDRLLEQKIAGLKALLTAPEMKLEPEPAATPSG